MLVQNQVWFDFNFFLFSVVIVVVVFALQQVPSFSVYTPSSEWFLITRDQDLFRVCPLLERTRRLHQQTANGSRVRLHKNFCILCSQKLRKMKNVHMGSGLQLKLYRAEQSSSAVFKDSAGCRLLSWRTRQPARKKNGGGDWFAVICCCEGSCSDSGKTCSGEGLVDILFYFLRSCLPLQKVKQHVSEGQCRAV